MYIYIYTNQTWTIPGASSTGRTNIDKGGPHRTITAQPKATYHGARYELRPSQAPENQINVYMYIYMNIYSYIYIIYTYVHV